MGKLKIIESAMMDFHPDHRLTEKDMAHIQGGALLRYPRSRSMMAVLVIKKRSGFAQKLMVATVALVIAITILLPI